MNEDKLILYYYNDDLSDAERREVAAAIEADPITSAIASPSCAHADPVRRICVFAPCPQNKPRSTGLTSANSPSDAPSDP